MCIRDRPMGGGFRISGKLLPTDGTAKIYRATVKQMFNKLKQVSSESRVPPDVKLFSDEQHTTLIPNHTGVCIGNEIDNGSRVFAASDYVTGLLEQIEDDKEGIAEGLGSGGKGKGGGGRGAPGVMGGKEGKTSGGKGPCGPGKATTGSSGNGKSLSLIHI